jgi:hypothetical protein
MSRSYRKPYCAVTGMASAKEDKRRAARGVRRKQEEWLRGLEDHDAALAPHRLECGGNEVWGWARDGKQGLMVPSGDEWAEAVWFRKLQRK